LLDDRQAWQGSWMAPFRVILLPGSVLPAELAYGSLVSALDSDAEAVWKELEVYATAEAPRDYTLDHEIAGVLRGADSRGWDRFHLVGYSGGGAASLAVAARHPERLSSLALLEPAWAGRWDLSPAEQAIWREYDRLEALPPDQFTCAFMRLNVKPGVELPPPPSGEPPPWMAKRPGGIRAFMKTFRTYDLDRGALARFDRPVYFALGGLSNLDQFGEIATRLSGVFSDFHLEVFEERHHFDPPHRIEPERLADSLKAFWSRADRAEPTHDAE
jgi:pimeloyl-ACP methyl ester carboxylesterase